MQRMTEQAGKNYHAFKNEYQEMVKIGEEFLRQKIFNSVRLEKFTEIKDGAKYYIYRYFPEHYQKYFLNEPQLPNFSVWHYILNHVLWMSDQMMNKIWWPKYGQQIETYISYYLDCFTMVVTEIEENYVVPELSISSKEE